MSAVMPISWKRPAPPMTPAPPLPPVEPPPSLMQVEKPKLRLPNVTLLGIDCLNLDRLILAARISTAGIGFGAVKLLTSIRQPSPFETVLIDAITTIEAYSKFCICDLYRYVDTPH